MKRIQSGAFAAIVCAAAVSLSAQTPPTPPAADTQPSYGSANKITVTGCVERAKGSATPTGTSGAAAMDTTKFVLNNVASSATETAGTSGSAKASIASSYRLDAEDSKLSPHVGHKIEVTGTVDEKPMGSPSSATAAKLKVETVKMIAATCTP